MKTTISIVTCSYQQGRFLESTLRSVLEQRYPGLEYIVMDGGSSDGSREIIQRYGSQLAHWQSAPDDGQTDALIRGFERSRGEIMGWLCSDDLLLRGSLQQVAHFFDTHPSADVVYGDAVWIDEAGDPIRTKREMGFNRFAYLFDHNFLPQPSVFWRRRLYERVGGLDRRFDLAMDSDLFERFSRVARLWHVPRYWSALRSYPAQKTLAFRDRGREEDALIRARSALGRHPLVVRAMRPAARGVRVAGRLAARGYLAAVPDAIRSELAALRIANPA